MYKVFIDNKPIIFTDSKHLTEKEAYYSSKMLTNLRKDLPLLFEKYPSVNEIVIACDDAENEFKRLFGAYKFIEAAGGIVSFGEYILCIKRNGVWDLPKGKIEKNESIEIAAIREIEEECGVSNLTILDALCTTYHTYTFKEKKVLKKTHWYRLSIKEKQELHPQTEEGITEASWIPLKMVDTYLSDTYASIKEVWLQFQEATTR